MPDPTPGQRAWTIYTRVDPLTFWEEWDKLHAEQRRAWETVAAAWRAADPPRREATAMPETPTPGQVCYEAWVCVDGHPRLRGWRELVLMERRRWEAAAQAVLAWQEESRCQPRDS